MRVTLLGTGVMGVGMVHALLRAGHTVTAWNRTAAKAAPLAGDGARVATDLADALAGAEVVVTMLFDAATVHDVLAGPLAEGAWPAGAVWLQTTTAGLDGTARLAALAAEHGVAFVDAPVLGTAGPAEQGALQVFCSGDPALEARVGPVLAAIGSRSEWLGPDAGRASGFKLVANAWIATITAATGQSVALARALDLDPRTFLDAIARGPMNSEYAQLKGTAMIDAAGGDGYGDVQFTVAGARKDAGLVADALAAHGLRTDLADGVVATLAAAVDAGHGEADMAAVVEGYPLT